jgi:hypothetical protein
LQTRQLLHTERAKASALEAQLADVRRVQSTQATNVSALGAKQEQDHASRQELHECNQQIERMQQDLRSFHESLQAANQHASAQMEQIQLSKQSMAATRAELQACNFVL